MIHPFNHGIWDAAQAAFRPFTMSVKTDNSGISNSDQFTLPLKSTGTYSFTVKWGDGSSNIITSYNQAEITHTYSVAGTYTVQIFGACDHIYFQNVGVSDGLKLLDITQWGDVVIGSMSSSYRHCQNLVGTWTDTPTFSGGTGENISFNNAFSYCYLLTNSTFDSWTMTQIGDCVQMFRNASVLDIEVSSWDVTGTGINLDDFMINTSLSTANYDTMLIAWATQNPTWASGCSLGVGSTTYTTATAGASRTTLAAATSSWTITDGGGI